MIDTILSIIAMLVAVAAAGLLVQNMLGPKSIVGSVEIMMDADYDYPITDVDIPWSRIAAREGADIGVSIMDPVRGIVKITKPGTYYISSDVFTITDTLVTRVPTNFIAIVKDSVMRKGVIASQVNHDYRLTFSAINISGMISISEPTEIIIYAGLPLGTLQADSTKLYITRIY